MRTTTTKKIEQLGEEAAAVVRALFPQKMTAAVLYGSEDLRIERIDVPALDADEVLLRVRRALRDGTALKVGQRGYHARMIQPPAVFGHEVVGEIAALGKRVDSRWRVGQRVIAANSAPCLRCFHCRRGQENLCEDLLFNNGAYAEYLRIPGRIVMENMLEVPHSVDDGSAALVEPLACVLRGIHEMEVRTGDTAVVIGCGPIGLKYVRMLSRRGLRVIALARRAAPLELARRLGASATINVTEVPDLVSAVKDLTEDRRRQHPPPEKGARDGSPWRRGEFLQWPARRPIRRNRASRDSLFRDQDYFAVPSHAALHPRSARSDSSWRHSRPRLRYRRDSPR